LKKKSQQKLDQMKKTFKDQLEEKLAQISELKDKTEDQDRVQKDQLENINQLEENVKKFKDQISDLEVILRRFKR